MRLLPHVQIGMLEGEPPTYVPWKYTLMELGIGTIQVIAPSYSLTHLPSHFSSAHWPPVFSGYVPVQRHHSLHARLLQ